MTNQIKPTRIVRLDNAVYASLEKKFSRLVVTTTTTPLEVSFQLGVQSVLQHLREALVIEEPNAVS